MEDGGEHVLETTMAIYKRGRVPNEIAELRLLQAPLSVDSVYSISTMHYCGDEALRAFAQAVGLQQVDTSSKPSTRILDFGSGYGGDALKLANEYQAHVTALELQPAVHTEAANLAQELGFSTDRLTFVCGDLCELPSSSLCENGFDAVYSTLVILHIQDRASIFKHLAASMRPGGLLFVDDYFARQELTSQDLNDLAGPVACPYLPSEAEYKKDLVVAGFELVSWTDKTEEWASFTAERAAAFKANSDRNSRVHGEALLADLLHFYDTVVRLFQRGNLGGVRYIARKL